MSNRQNQSEPKCMVLFCQNKGKIPGISYFRMTKNRYKTWLVALGFDPDKETRSHFNKICSKHFAPEDVSITPKGKKSLNHGAVPKLYLGPNIEQRKAWKALQQTPISPPSPVAETSVDNFEHVGILLEAPGAEVEVSYLKQDVDQESIRSSTSTITSSSTGAIESDGFFDSIGLQGTPKKRKKLFKILHTNCLPPGRQSKQEKNPLAMIKQNQRELYNLTRKVGRLQKKVTNLEQIIKDLCKKRLMSSDV